MLPGGYYGEIKKGERHGWGENKWENGYRYVGNWRHGKMSGQGTYFFKSGTKHVGGFRDNVRHGKGIQTWPIGNDSELKGVWKNDKIFDGIQTSPNGSDIIAVWKNGVLTKKKSPDPSPPKVVQKPKSQLPPTPNEGSSVSQEIKRASSGSGFAVSSDGFIMTNNHVINGCKKVFIHSNGKQIPAAIVTYDQQNDLALLKANFKPDAVFPLSVDRPEILQDIYVAGYPFGMNVSTSVKVTKGIISSLTGIGNNFSEIQIDAALQSGNSGGPILDEKGNVVGVAVSKLDVKYALKNFGAIPENTNFGIKSSVVGSILDSNGVNMPDPNRASISKSDLGKKISRGTYYISCWMTVAQIEAMRAKKVMFEQIQ
jgi:S1-C subfamily serine protease